MTPTPLQALVGAALFAVLTSTPSDAARQKKQNIPQVSFDQHGITQQHSSLPVQRERRVIRSRTRASAPFGVQGDPRPHRWCSWYLRRELGVPIRAFPKWSQNIAAAWRHVGTPASGPAVGVVVVWPRHVGYITRRTSTGWVVKSGNDGGAVRERERSLRGVIAYRWVSRSASKPRHVIASLPPQTKSRQAPKQKHDAPAVAPWTATAAYVEPDFEFAIHLDPTRPEPIQWGDRRDIFRRYVESKDVVVGSHTSLTCDNGKPVSASLQTMLRDASAHFGRTAYVNSGCRNWKRNRQVGGARNSQHLVGRAVDFRLSGVAVGTLRGWVMANAGRYGVKGVGIYSTHVHADDRVKTTKLVTWTGGRKKKRPTYYAKRKHQRYAAAG